MPPPINSRQVEAFRAVMLTGGMTSAAELMSVTQPAVSRLVRDLELSLRLALFERRGNQIIPTPDAVSLLAEVERSFVGLGRIADLAAAIRSQSAGSLRLAAMPALASAFLPRFAGRFVRDRPDLRLSVDGMPSHMVVEAVAAGQVDVGYAVGPLERPGFEVEKLPSSAVAILPAGHRLAGRRTITASDFAGERFVSPAYGTLFQARIEAAFADIPRIVRVETPLSGIACALVAEGVGVSLVDPFSPEEFRDRGLVARAFRPEIEIGTVQIRLRNRPLTPLAARFIAEFRRRMTVIADGYA